MRHNDGSAPAAFRRCSPIASRSVSKALIAALLLVSCAGGASGTPGPVPTARALVISDIASTQLSGRAGGPAIVVATDDRTRAEIGQVRGVAVPTSVVGVGAFQGE